MPIADHNQDEQEESHEKQSGGLSGIAGMPVMMLFIGSRLDRGSSHERILVLFAMDRYQPAMVRPLSSFGHKQ
jgi:hypothetical protein